MAAVLGTVLFAHDEMLVESNIDTVPEISTAQRSRGSSRFHAQEAQLAAGNRPLDSVNNPESN